MARNLCTDPAGTSAAWTTVPAPGAGGAGNNTTANVAGMTRPTARRAQNAGGAAAQGVYGPALPVAPGQAVSAIIEALPSSAVSLTWYLIFYSNAAGTATVNGGVVTGPSLAAGSVTANTAYSRVITTASAPAEAVSVRAAVISGSAPASASLYGTACRYVFGLDPALTFADGVSYGWTWDGAANASTSTSRDHNAGALALLASDLARPPRPYEFAETFTGKPNRAVVNGTRADTGQTWISVPSGGANPQAGFDVRGGSMGVPVGHQLGSGYGYAQWDCGAGRVAGHVGCTLVWGNSSSTDGRACLGAFNVVADQFTSTNGGATMHLTLQPNQVVMAVVTAGINSYTNISPVSGGPPEQVLPVPMAADGVTEYRVDVWLDRARNLAFCTVGNNPTLVYNYGAVSSINGRYAFWETGAVSASGLNVPRFTRVWSDVYGA